ncbi:hypothetical protein GH714_043677 [Hevea brasiliensis]|uniref:A20-type domain-containing protein n=1 Tax=Hevea brasiliensis TaxID=3981 RepID=A0A6A6K310_HEVBR|nr:hypothetical protein GH714_043677 [Hevea brasiliensis]
MESQRNKEPPLCANGCGFYGTVQNRNLCSKCYEEYQEQEENASSFLHGKVKCSRLLKHHQRNMLLTEVSNVSPKFRREYLKLNHLGYVSVLVVGETVVFDSFAILMNKQANFETVASKMYFEAKVANIVSSTIQPLQNQPMLNFVEDKVGPDEKLAWAQYYIGKGFADSVPSSTEAVCSIQ